jgi:hypothetical protein
MALASGLAPRWSPFVVGAGDEREGGPWSFRVVLLRGLLAMMMGWRP